MLERLKQQVSPFLQANRWFIAYSGGLDSHVLLHLMSSLVRENPDYPPLVAIHINHQIQATANQWEEHCRNQAIDLGVEFVSFRVHVDSSRNLEQNARDARYKVFAEVLDVGDCLFVAHHQQDNIETFFYRLFRGAGLQGLSAIASQRKLSRGCLIRPLLWQDKESIRVYAVKHHLSYVDDPSNCDIRYDRNYIRQQLLPVIFERWPSFNINMQRFINHLQEANSLLLELAWQDLQMSSPEDDVEPSIDVVYILSHSIQRQKNMLRYWLSRHEVLLSDRQTNELLQQVINASEDAQPLLLVGKAAIRRYRSRLYIIWHSASGFSDIEWNGLESCVVPGYGVLSLSKPLDIVLQVTQRQGGEVIKPSGALHFRKLKTLLQEMAIPYWRRENIPLIYCEGNFIAVAELIRSDLADDYLPEITIQKIA